MKRGNFGDFRSNEKAPGLSTARCTAKGVIQSSTRYRRGGSETMAKIVADLLPSADGSAVRTFLVDGVLIV